MKNRARGVPGLEMRDVIKRSIKEMIGFSGSAQNETSGPEGARARNERFYKEQ